jgi:hypothetical protein
MAEIPNVCQIAAPSRTPEPSFCAMASIGKASEVSLQLCGPKKP